MTQNGFGYQNQFASFAMQNQPNTTPDTSSNQPTVNVASGGRPKRHRTAFNSHQLKVLEYEFKQSIVLSRQRRDAIAQRIKLPEKTIKIWFQNKRLKIKREAKLKLQSGVSTHPSIAPKQFPSTHFPSKQFPSTHFPSTQFPSTHFPSKQFPSTQLPVFKPTAATIIEHQVLPKPSTSFKPQLLIQMPKAKEMPPEGDKLRGLVLACGIDEDDILEDQVTSSDDVSPSPVWDSQIWCNEYPLAPTMDPVPENPSTALYNEYSSVPTMAQNPVPEIPSTVPYNEYSLAPTMDPVPENPSTALYNEYSSVPTMAQNPVPENPSTAPYNEYSSVATMALQESASPADSHIWNNGSSIPSTIENFGSPALYNEYSSVARMASNPVLEYSSPAGNSLIWNNEPQFPCPELYNEYSSVNPVPTIPSTAPYNEYSSLAKMALQESSSPADIWNNGSSLPPMDFNASTTTKTLDIPCDNIATASTHNNSDEIPLFELLDDLYRPSIQETLPPSPPLDNTLDTSMILSHSMLTPDSVPESSFLDDILADIFPSTPSSVPKQIPTPPNTPKAYMPVELGLDDIFGEDFKILL